MLEMSQEFTEIAAAFAAAQAEFPELLPDSEGRIEGQSRGSGKEFSFSYDYASLGAVLGTFRPVLARHGIAVLQPTHHRTEQDVVIIDVQTWLMHKSGQWFRSMVNSVSVPSGDLKKVGGAITYLRRYQIGALLGVAPEEDKGADGEGQRKDHVRSPPPAQNGGGNFQCRHGHRHTTAQGAKECQDGAPAADKTLEPGQDPDAMKGKEQEIRDAIAKADWRAATMLLNAMPIGSVKHRLQEAYNAARYPKEVK